MEEASAYFHLGHNSGRTHNHTALAISWPITKRPVHRLSSCLRAQLHHFGLSHSIKACISSEPNSLPMVPTMSLTPHRCPMAESFSSPPETNGSKCSSLSLSQAAIVQNIRVQSKTS
ncbi:hypothetical protein M5689_007195 [Euphorbia peplus]|nr:hypothetical protein M5689_007195 [Euphorbia peplus]